MQRIYRWLIVAVANRDCWRDCWGQPWARQRAWASFVCEGCLIREFPQLASSNSAVRVPSPGLGPDSPQGEWLAVRNTEGNELNPKGEWLDVRNIEDNELNCYN